MDTQSHPNKKDCWSWEALEGQLHGVDPKHHWQMTRPAVYMQESPGSGDPDKERHGDSNKLPILDIPA